MEVGCGDIGNFLLPFPSPLLRIPTIPYELRLSSSSSSIRLLVMADKLRAQQQLEQLQARYVGTGHADTTKFEWTSNIQRDSFASYIGHPPLLHYMSIGMGEPKEKVRVRMIEASIYRHPSTSIRLTPGRK